MRHLDFTGSTLSAAVPTPIRGLHSLRGGRWHEGGFVGRRMRLLQSSIISLVCLTAAIVSPTPALAQPSIVVSVPDQTLALINDGVVVARYRVSTSKFGLGDGNGTYATPLGAMAVASKIGANAPLGAVFKNRQPTGEVLKPNAPGRDPIVSRILWLRGLEKQNARAYSRNIYIHGTPEERLIGRPASYGCIRMRSQDVAQLFNAVPVGTKIEIANAGLGSAVAKAKLESQTRTSRIAAN
ncbi:MAG TPA: L,D-transpeptidase [Chthoniobacterales bacterium]|nr:L,D-transpeptidase [Chthoniobacterales bacterium]